MTPPRGTERRPRHARGLLRERAQEGRDQRRQTGDHEERSPRDPGRLPGLRDENLQDRQTRGLGLPDRQRGGEPRRPVVRKTVDDRSTGRSECALPALTRERDVREAYAAHSGELYGFAVRSLGDAGLAEEAVQETFLRAWKAGERYDPEIGS